MRKKILTKDQLLKAMTHTKSNMAAARFLGCSYQHYKKYAKLYKDNESGKTLFDIHLNPSGKGIRKFVGGYGNSKVIVPLLDILEGRTDIAHYEPGLIKTRLIQEGFLKEECCSCGFTERRVLDYKVPLILNFRNKNNRDWKSENLELLCYNCYFLHIGNVWSDNQLEQMEEYTTENKFKQDEAPDFELDDSHIQHLKDLGIWSDDDISDSGLIDKW